MEISILSDDLVGARHHLLQTCLRPDFDEYPIEKEYPIVLDPQRKGFSICAYEWNSAKDTDKKLVAHANLWPRVLMHGLQRFPIGLVGNVATAESHRGKGIMRQLMTWLWEYATGSGLEALLLWSDLVEFYHKLGFEPRGRERRYFFSATKLARVQTNCELVVIKGSTLDKGFLQNLLDMRYPTAATIERNSQEFFALLQIPDSVLVLAEREGKPCGFAIVGKGYDMVGVVHEWGVAAGEVAVLLSLLRFITDTTGWPQLGLLAPFEFSERFQIGFMPYLMKEEVFPLVLIKTENARIAAAIDQGFLWGLDSI